MKLVAYLRTSTQEQNLGLEVQRDGVQAYAKLYNHELVRVLVEKQSGKDLNRPQLKVALQMIADGVVDGVIIYKIDRLSRSVADLSRLVDGPLSGASLISVSEQLDTSSANGRLMLNILSSMAQFEREQLSERTSQALQALKKKGVKLGRPRATAKRRYARRLRNQGYALRVIGERLAEREGREKAYTPQAVASLLKK